MNNDDYGDEDDDYDGWCFIHFKVMIDPIDWHEMTDQTFKHCDTVDKSHKLPVHVQS